MERFAIEKLIAWKDSADRKPMVLLNRVYNVSKPEHPLPAFDKPDSFKLYLFDTGLLKCMAGIDNGAILLKSNYQFKGSLILDNLDAIIAINAMPLHENQGKQMTERE